MATVSSGLEFQVHGQGEGRKEGKGNAREAISFHRPYLIATDLIHHMARQNWSDRIKMSEFKEQMSHSLMRISSKGIEN